MKKLYYAQRYFHSDPDFWKENIKKILDKEYPIDWTKTKDELYADKEFFKMLNRQSVLYVIFQHRFILLESLKEIAKIEHVSHERIRCREARLYRLMYNYKNS